MLKEKLNGQYLIKSLLMVLGSWCCILIVCTYLLLQAPQPQEIAKPLIASSIVTRIVLFLLFIYWVCSFIPMWAIVMLLTRFFPGWYTTKKAAFVWGMWHFGILLLCLYTFHINVPLAHM